MRRKRNEIMQEAQGLNIQQDEALAAFLSARPPWIVRWGTMLFFLLVTLLVAIASFIHYPDKVLTSGQLLSVNGPQPLVIRREGRLQALLQRDGDTVLAGSLIAALESTVDYRLIASHRVLADSVYKLLSDNSYVSAYMCQQLLTQRSEHLGELEGEYQLFKNALLQYSQYLPGHYYTNHQKQLHKDWNILRQQDVLLNEQRLLAQEDLALANANFAAQSKLVDQKVIAPLEYGAEKSKWLGKKMIVPQYEATRLNNAAQQLEKQKEIATIANELAMEPYKFRQSLEKWIAAIAMWEQQYLLYAPCNGLLSFERFVNDGRYMKTGEWLGSVQPPRASFFIEATLPQHNFGKLVPGQHALLRFDAWPYEEFGMLMGRLEKVKAIPNDSGYLALISLPNGLTTDRNILLQYQEGLHVAVEIVTEDRSLLARLFAGFVKSFGQ